MKRGRPVQPERYHPDSVYQRARRTGYNQLAGDPFGRLAIAGHFPEYQLATVTKMREIYAEWCKHAELKPNAVSPSFEVSSGRSPVTETDSEAAVLAKRAFDRLKDELARFPPGLRTALWRLCIEEKVAPENSLPYIKAALEILSGTMGYKILKKKLDKSRRVTD